MGWGTKADPANETFRQRLIAAMAARGMTIDELAARTGLATSLISEYRAGRNAPRIKSLTKLCAALGVSADFMIGLLGD